MIIVASAKFITSFQPFELCFNSDARLFEARLFNDDIEPQKKREHRKKISWSAVEPVITISLPLATLRADAGAGGDGVATPPTLSTMRSVGVSNWLCVLAHGENSVEKQQESTYSPNVVHLSGPAPTLAVN
jgi:hypothetical protein